MNQKSEYEVQLMGLKRELESIHKTYGDYQNYNNLILKTNKSTITAL
jgi:hypothetical protein